MFVWNSLTKSRDENIFRGLAASAQNIKEIDVCFQPWCNPLWLTGLKTPTNQASN